MVCIYCLSETDVTNSRPKARTPSVWRRRACNACKANFTTLELPDYTKSLSVASDTSRTQFNRDKLFMSLYKSLAHRPDALTSATALTSTIIGKLLKDPHNITDKAIASPLIARITYETLKRYDVLAATSYKAYHQKSLKLKVKG